MTPSTYWIMTSMFTFDPLAQFEVVNVLNLYFHVSNMSIFVFFVFWCVNVFFLFGTASGDYNIFQFLLFSLLRLVNSIIADNTTMKRKQYFSIFFYLFLFIFFSNTVGLLPYSWAITNSFVVTFYLAFTYFFGINLMAIWRNGFEYFNLFLPSGVPLALAPLIVLIEIVSYFSRVFSLSIRLFANISSGHALLKILTGFSWAIISGLVFHTMPIDFFLTIINFILPWVVVTLLFFLEFLISFLQSYVFIILLSIYINDVLNSEH